MQPGGDIAKFLAQFPLFKGLDPLALVDLGRIVELFEVEPGATLFRQGDAGNGLYLVTDGAIQIHARAPGDEAVHIVSISSGGLVGEAALLDGSPRSATVTTTSGASGYFIPRERFEAQVRDSRPAAFALVDRVRGEVARRIRATISSIAALPLSAVVAGGRSHGVYRQGPTKSDADVAALLGSLAPFAAMTPKQAASLVGKGECITIARGELIAPAGSPGEWLHVVLRGALRTAIPRGDSCEQLLLHGPGDLVGLLALLDEGPLASELSVREDAILLRIDRATFEALRKGEGEGAQALFLAANRQLVRDLRRLTRHLGRALGLLAFNAGGSADV